MISTFLNLHSILKCLILEAARYSLSCASSSPNHVHYKQHVPFKLCVEILLLIFIHSYGTCMWQISPIQSLIGQTGKRWVMGVISQLEDGHFFLEDLTASVEINLSNAISFTQLTVFFSIYGWDIGLFALPEVGSYILKTHSMQKTPRIFLACIVAPVLLLFDLTHFSACNCNPLDVKNLLHPWIWFTYDLISIGLWFIQITRIGHFSECDELNPLLKLVLMLLIRCMYTLSFTYQFIKCWILL